MKAIKEFCKDYKTLQDTTSVFYRKHWKGVILLNVGLLGVCAGTVTVIGAAYALKEKIASKNNDEEIEEENEADDKSEFRKSTEETFKVLRERQRS